MRRPAKLTLIVAATVAMGASGTLAYANWNVPISRADMAGTATTMPKGATPTAKVDGRQAVVTWSTQEIAPTVPMQQYVVTARDVGAAPHPNVVRTVTASRDSVQSTTFGADVLAGGEWRWSVIPRFGLWTGPESEPSSPPLTFAATTPATVLAAGARGAGGTTSSTVAPAATTSPATASDPQATPVPTATTSAVSAPATTAVAPPTTTAPERSTPPPPAEEDSTPTAGATGEAAAKADFGAVDPSVSPSS